MTQAFNLSQLANNVNTSGQLNAAVGLYNQTPVANGGTGVASVTSGTLLLGAGTSAMTELTGGTVGYIVTWNGSAWVSSANTGAAAPVTNVYATPATWTKPATLKAVKVTVIGGGGGGAAGRGAIPNVSIQSGQGGGGGSAISWIAAPAIPGPIAVTVGTGGAGGAGPGTPGTTNPGSPGNTSSFGTLVTATGGTTGGGSPGAGGTGTGNLAVTGGRASFSGNGSDTNGTIMSIATAGPNAPGSGSKAGAPYGGGGTGVYTASLASSVFSGGNGANGVVIVEEFY